MESGEWRAMAIMLLFICIFLLVAEVYEQYDGFLTVNGYCEDIYNQNVTIDGITYHCSYIPNSLFDLEGRNISITFVEDDAGLILRSTGCWKGTNKLVYPINKEV